MATSLPGMAGYGHPLPAQDGAAAASDTQVTTLSEEDPMLILVVLVLGFFLMAGACGWWVIGSTITDGRKQKAIEDHAEEILDHWFLDAGDQVVYRPVGRVGLTLETLVDGAVIRGYRMVSQSGQMATWRVVFERV